MFEIAISTALIGLFVLMSWAASAASESILYAGLVFAAIGFAYGIPAAGVYHWRLYRSLLAAGRLPVRWWLNPTALHDQIPAADRRRVLTWGALGGSGFVVIVLGILLTTFGLWRTFSAAAAIA